MASLTEFCRISVTVDFTMIGNVPSGMRIDVPFTGTATSSHWEGERPVQGVDYVTIAATGRQSLNIRGTIGAGEEVVAYQATGVGTAEGPQELFLFETANPSLAFLNERVGVAIGSLDGNKLDLVVHLVER